MGRGKQDAASAPGLEDAIQSIASVLESSPEPALVIGRDGTVLHANRACEALLARSRAMLVGRSPTEWIVPEAEWSIAREPLSQRDGALRGVVEVRRRDGQARIVTFSARALDVAGAPAIAAVSFLRDETEQRRTQYRLSARNEQLEGAIRAVCHDLRSPLVSVLGFSRLLREEFASRLGESGLHFLERIEQGGRNMEQRIRDLLDFARIGHTSEARTLVDPREVLEQLRAELKPRLDAQGVRLALPDEAPLLYCDRTRLYQVLAHLLGNALDHMGPHSDPRIEVDAAAERGWHRLSVRDNGRGIEPDHQERIFDLFQSGPRTDGRRGTGLGLSIVKKIVESHGGHVSVESAPGAGATFHIVLPPPE
jgi:PAS domain S-box-containing protein